jgi:tetratricopeptide (TPR) repeat protein
MKVFGFPTGLLLIALGTAIAAELHADTLEDARALMREGRHEDAVKRLDSHLRTSPNDSTARFLNGVALAEAGRRQEAIDTFSALVKDFPGLSEPHNNLAALYAAAGDLEKARDHLMEAIRIHPSYATAHENLGDVYAEMAALSYSEALALDGANQSARAKYALINELGGVGGGTGSASSAMMAPSPSATVAAAPLLPVALPLPASKIGDEVLATLKGWADAWSSQDVDAYLSHYAPSFVPADGRSKESWTILRRKRISGPRFIDIRIAQPEVNRTGEDRASVTFSQSYRSENYTDQVIKKLDMVRQGGEWRIVSEVTVE